MKAKLIIGEYAYLYHGDLKIEDLYQEISKLTRYSYIIKWKDEDDDLITIRRQNDLQYCSQQAKLKNKKSLKLFIIEQLKQKPPPPQSNIQLQNVSQQQNQEIKPIMVESQENFQSQVTFACQAQQKQQQNEIAKSKIREDYDMSAEEKKKYCDYIVIQMMEEIYPGLQGFLSQKLSKSQSVKPASQDLPDHCNKPLARFPSQYQYTPVSIPSNLEQSIQIPADSEEVDDFPPSFNQFTLKRNVSLYEEVALPTNPENKQQSEHSDTEFAYCDYCSEMIQNIKSCYVCHDSECIDFHFCENCVNKFKEDVHEHIVQAIK